MKTRIFAILLVILLNVMHVAAEQMLLTQQMANKAKNTLVIDQDYTLGGKTVTLPKKCRIIVKEGGRLDNGTIRGKQSQIMAERDLTFIGKSLRIEGSWRQEEIWDDWFEFDNSKTFVSNLLIDNMLALCDDFIDNHIHLQRGRTYYVELPYKGRSDVAELISFHMESGKKMRHYEEFFGEGYEYLHVFTIPSNTRLTIEGRLQLLPNYMGVYFLFYENDKRNITIDGGGEIWGDNSNHLMSKPLTKEGYRGEWGFLFMCLRCHDFTFRDVTIAEAFGDCIYYSGSFLPEDAGERWGSGLVMDNVKVLRARRNGVTLSARDCLIRDCHFEGNGMVNGTLPKAGIDFESDYIAKYPTELGNRDVVMENCTFVNNGRDMSAANNNLASYGRLATTIRNCHFGNKIHISWGHWLRFENCTFNGFVGDYDKPVDAKNAIKNTQFINCVINGMPDIVRQRQDWNNLFQQCQFND